MNKKMAFGVVLLWSVACSVLAAPTIEVGTYGVLPGDTSRRIAIYGWGGGQVEGLDFYVQVGDGGPDNDGTDTKPVITAVDIIGPGTLFSASNTGSNPFNLGPLMWNDSTTTNIDVQPSLTLPTAQADKAPIAYVTVGATGTADGQTYALRVKGVATSVFPPNGFDTAFAGIVPTYVNGGVGQLAIRSVHGMVWNAGASGNWADSTWTGQPPTFPDYTADASVNTAWTVTVDRAREANSLAVSNGGKVLVTSAGSLNVTASATVSAAATLEVAGTLTAKSMVGAGNVLIDGGGLATIRATTVPNDTSSTSRLSSLSIAGGAAPTGTLDLNTNSLVIDYSGAIGTTLTDVTAQIKAGRNGVDGNAQANWNGKGIITSTGRAANVAITVDRYNIGAINNADLAAASINPVFTTFAGQAVAPNTVLVKYTYTGDANLDGKVDGDDYSYWLNGFLNTTDPSVQGWLRGDFDYNGVIDADDYTQWLNSFLAGGAPIAGGSPAAVPEPATLVLLALGGLALWSAAIYRRLRRQM